MIMIFQWGNHPPSLLPKMSSKHCIGPLGPVAQLTGYPLVRLMGKSPHKSSISMGVFFPIAMLKNHAAGNHQ
jgi:hypothetical protein